MAATPIAELAGPHLVDGWIGLRESGRATAPPAGPPAAEGPGEVSFESVLRHMVSDVNAVDAAAAVKEAALARGASDDLHGTMIAVKEAEIGVKLVGTIRNKLLDAFNDIWKTSV